MLLDTTMILSQEDLETIMLAILDEIKRLETKLRNTKNKERRNLINDALKNLSDIMLKLEKASVDIKLEIANREEE